MKNDRRVLGVCERDHQAKRRVLWRKVDEDEQEVPGQDKPLYGMHRRQISEASDTGESHL